MEQDLLNRTSLKLAVASGVFFALLAGGLRLLGAALSPGLFLILTITATLSSYLVSWYFLAKRLREARNSLRRIRRHNFNNIKPEAPLNGDELDDLLWQVFHTGQALEREIAELRKMENYRREFLGDVSHELKTPIFSIKGFAETLRDGALNDEKVNQRFIHKILRNAERLKNLAEDLSDIARLERGELHLNNDRIELGELADEVIETLELQAEEREITLRSRVSDHIPAVKGDRERIRQVLLNLVENAIKYNQPGGWVEIDARLQKEGNIEISVRDDGIGIAEEDIPRLTERFYRVDRSRSRKQGGTGLGLSIVKHILEAHDRELQIESSHGEGSRFYFLLPQAEEKSIPTPTEE